MGRLFSFRWAQGHLHHWACCFFTILLSAEESPWFPLMMFLSWYSRTSTEAIHTPMKWLLPSNPAWFVLIRLYSHYIIYFSQPVDMVVILICLLQMRKMRLRTLKWCIKLTQSAGRWWSHPDWDCSRGLRYSLSALSLHTSLPCYSPSILLISAGSCMLAALKSTPLKIDTLSHFSNCLRWLSCCRVDLNLQTDLIRIASNCAPF